MIDRCSAISFKRSRRELSIDVAEHRSTLKNNLNTYYLLIFTPKTDKNPLKQVFPTVFDEKYSTTEKVSRIDLN